MQPVVMVDGEYSASLDGLSLPGDTILEVKCPMKGKDSEAWKRAELGQVERHYEVQIQQQLMVSGAKKCHFWVFNGKTGVMVEVLPNPADVKIIKAGWDAFMKFVVSDTPPPLTPLDTVYRDDEAWRSAAEAYISRKSAVEVALAKTREADRAVRMKIEVTMLNFAETLSAEDRQKLAEGLAKKGPLRQPPMMTLKDD